MKVLVADDHPLVRHGLKQLLLDNDMDVTVDEACDGPETIRKVREGNPGLVLLDIHMTGKNGVEVLRELTRERPQLPVLMLSLFSEEECAVEALRAGAAGYVSKNGPPGELLAAIKRVCSGKKYFSNSVKRRCCRDPAGE